MMARHCCAFWAIDRHREGAAELIRETFWYFSFFDRILHSLYTDYRAKADTSHQGDAGAAARVSVALICNYLVL